LIEALCQACEPFVIVPHAKPRNGQLAIELPPHAPVELYQIAEEIEQLSDCMCQRCGDGGAIEIMVWQHEWILIACPACQGILLKAMNNKRI
jgi:hypothetical protein